MAFFPATPKGCENFEIVCSHTRKLEQTFVFLAGQIPIWIHSLVHLTLKFQKFNLDDLGVVLFSPGYQQFF